MDNEELAELEPITRLLFIFLWMLADREGRLDDRPKRIAAQALAYDRTADVGAMLDSLQGLGFITRYTANGIACIQLTGFGKHQTPHGTEKDSVLPDADGATTTHIRGKNGYATGQVQVVNGSLTVKKQNVNTLIPDSGYLIPDSGLPDSLIPDSLVVQDKPAKQKTRRCQVPDDFYPNDNNLFAFNKTGLNLGHEIGKFMDHHKAKGSLMADWQAAWRTWVSNGEKFAKTTPAKHESFRERDERAARERYEAATGQRRPAIKQVFDEQGVLQ